MPKPTPAPAAPSRLDLRPDHSQDPALDVLLDCLPPWPGSSPVLVVDDPAGLAEDALSGRGMLVTGWRRLAQGKRKASAWPEGSGFVAATLRMPRSKEALDFALDAIATVLAPGGEVFVYGGNDEGIKSVGKRLEQGWAAVETLDARKHSRVWRARLPDAPRPARPLDEHARSSTITVPWGSFEHVVLPGVFAKGGLDDASLLLLASMAAPAPGAHVLDFACGPGTLAQALLLREPSLKLQLLDADAPAVWCAKRNLPGCLVACGDSWGALPTYQRYDLIVSNPPIHSGKARDYTVVKRLIEGAAARLLPKGSLVLVVQAQVPVADTLNAHFDLVEVIAEDGRFKVWRTGRLRDRYPEVVDEAPAPRGRR
jgi:16S rRNA (guanine1207-N2)-methyltransferase